MRGLCLPLLACACALVSLREALATNYAVSSEKAKLVCGFSQALKDSAKGLTTAAVSVLERTAEASAKAAILRGRLAAMLRQAQGHGGEVGGAARDTKQEARAQLQAHLAIAEQRIAKAGHNAQAAAKKANTYSVQSARLAGHMDGMIAMLATWYGGKSTATRNAMCIAKTPTTVQKWEGRLQGTLTRNAAGDLSGCLKDFANVETHGEVVKGMTRTKTELIMKAVTDGAEKVAALVDQVADNKAISADSNDDANCPLLSASTKATGNVLWNGAANKPYVKLGGLWALRGGSNNIAIELDTREPKDEEDTEVPADENASQIKTAAQHPLVAAAISTGGQATDSINSAEAALADAQQQLAQNITLTGKGIEGQRTLGEWVTWLEGTQSEKDAKRATQPRESTAARRSAQGSNGSAQKETEEQGDTLAQDSATGSANTGSNRDQAKTRTHASTTLSALKIALAAQRGHA
ncbi:hypothetical protein, conserved in T. vivax [Trypanosoma vivax Y486]|uniref:Trypanosome variant surface glycoprotein A-type N-terminal domain-containing protein n=1 Tax=Trypanosoma vivax (strain Y486) TaxID=1055687 RepID=F9WMM1_TRYVY|nr:hypothetical protein, conserved in T. vivax [Trypanosoma vivax Y486]|eukprot:CCD18778.1 hypothetical protein, conserved in T. vivax [Trypanosoma vivax Y486]